MMMSKPASVFVLREARDAARARFDAGIRQVKADLDASSVGARVAGKLQDDARKAANYALDVAGDNKGVIAGTGGAIALWLLRDPITGWFESHFGENDLPEDDEDSVEDNTNG
jgi:hypothetical protein